jgi:hypothetical protein
MSTAKTGHSRKVSEMPLSAGKRQNAVSASKIMIED